MDELQAKIKADKEAKKKRLDELKAAKQAREEGKRRDVPRTSDSSDATPEPTLRDVEQAKPAEPLFYTPKPTLSAYTTSLSCQPRPKVLKYEREIQVELDLPAKQKEKKEDSEPDPDTKAVTQASSIPTVPIKEPGESFKKPEVKVPNFEQMAESPDFTEFFRHSISLVERALEQEFDVCETFHGDDAGAALDTHSRLKTISTLKAEFDENRCVGCLQWSPSNEDCFLTGYSLAGPDSGNYPRGIIKIWSLAAQNKPINSLICQSTVTSAAFADTEANIVFGGLYSGQIVTWDLRAKSAPVQRTSLIPEAHNQPIVSVMVYSTQGVSQVMSLSSEGKICLWALNMLHKPLRVTEAKYPGKDFACTSSTCPLPESEQFHVGMEDGSILEATLKPSKSEDVEETVLAGHSGPVTCLRRHGPGEVEEFTESVGGLVLSTSVDWTVKLWHPASKPTPLLTFESYEEYVYTAAWSPSHPSTFAVGDGDGYLDIWDLLNSSESPLVRQKVSEGAINQTAWSVHGSRLAAGTSRGEVGVYQLEQEQGKPSDWAHLETLLGLGNSSQRYSASIMALQAEIGRFMPWRCAYCEVYEEKANSRQCFPEVFPSNNRLSKQKSSSE